MEDWFSVLESCRISPECVGNIDAVGCMVAVGSVGGADRWMLYHVVSFYSGVSSDVFIDHNNDLVTLNVSSTEP